MNDYEFKNESLLKTALTHSSFANESDGRFQSYERMEFLGDSILSAVSSAHIYENCSELNEGNMSKLRASLVCEESLAEQAKKMGLAEKIQLGKGEAQSGIVKDSIIADVLEAVIGAIYLDGGFLEAQKFILSWLPAVMEQGETFCDYKTLLQEKLQQKGETVVYKIEDESGPEHDKTFFVSAIFKDAVVGTGEGKSRKKAEQAAAKNALLNL